MKILEKRKIEKLRKIALEKKEREEQIKEEKRLRYESRKQALRDEIKLAKERELDLKKFLREEQAILRREQAKKRKKFLEEIKLEKKIESFRKRELLEIKNLEKFALREEVQDYRTGVEERIEKIKEKYKLIREQKIRERVESLGVDISDVDTKEDLLRKEKEYAELFANPYNAAARGFIDEVIHPSQTRIKVIKSLKMLELKAG